MKSTKKIILCLILFIAIVTIKTKVNATEISVTPSKPKVGDRITVTIKVPNVHTVDVTANISGVVSGSIKVVGGDMAGKTKTYTNSATYECKKEGKINIVISNNSTAVLNGKYVPNLVTSKTVTVSKKKTSSNDSSNDSESSATTVSSDATLKNLGIRPNDFTGFRKATMSYSVSVPKNVDKVSIYAEATNPKATVTGTGTKTLQIGKNTFNIKVTAEDKKTTKTYTLVITRKNEDENASDATLTNLGIRPKEYDFTGFKTGTLSYNASVPYDIDKITIYATAKSEKATITGTGSKTLQVGSNKCTVIVTSENKKVTKTYVINVTRKEQEEKTEENEKENDEENNNKEDDDKENLDEEKLSEGLKNIEIKGYNIEPSFSQDTYSYKVDIPSCNGKLEIDTETTGDDIEVEVAGNEDIRQGENIITILVHNKKDDSTETYQITANIEKYLSAENEDKNDSENKIKTWGIIGAISAIIIFMIVIFIRKYKRENEEFFDEDDTEDNEYEQRNEYYTQTNRYEEQTEEERTSKTNEDLRNIGLFDDTQKIEYDDYDEPRKHGRYKGRRFK